MKKEALELVRKIYERLKWDIPHPNLEEIFEASKSQALFMLDAMAEENPFKKEKYEMTKEEVNKLTPKIVLS